MRYLLLSVFVVSLVGVLVIPHVFAETDNDIVTCCVSATSVGDGDVFSIEVPDGWLFGEGKGNPTASIEDEDGDTIIRITTWWYFKLNEPSGAVFAPNDLPYPEDYTDKDMRNMISGKNQWYCSVEVVDDPIQHWNGCYKFDVVDEETTFTNEGRKLHMVEMKYILLDYSYYSIVAEIWDDKAAYKFSARTIVKDNKQSYKFDEKNLEKIRDVIKSFVILKPNIELEPEPEPETSIPEPEISIPEPETSIPDWIKNNAGWWADGFIDDSAFLQGIQFLIKEGIMIIPPAETSESTESQEVPGWIKNNASWWAKGQIDDNAFVSGIQYLVKVGIIKVS